MEHVDVDWIHIAYTQAGFGPPLVLLHGAPTDSRTWQWMLPDLARDHTVIAWDAPGFGQSSDIDDMWRAAQFADALADFIAALEPEGWHVPDPNMYALPEGLEIRLDGLLAAGDRDGVVELLFRDLENMSNEDMAAFKAAPSWAGRVAAAHTITREIRGEMTALLVRELARRIAVPVLLVTGESSADASKASIDRVAAALPNARILILEGQEHVADVLNPERFAAHIVPFITSDD